MLVALTKIQTFAKKWTPLIYNLYLCIYRCPANIGSTSWWGNHRVDPLPSWACREGRDTLTGLLKLRIEDRCLNVF